MTQRPPPSSTVSRQKNRSKTQSTPEISQPPVPSRVKKPARFRPPRPVSRSQQAEALSWSYAEDPQPYQQSAQHQPDLSSTGDQASTQDSKALHDRGSFDLLAFESPQQATEDIASSLPVGSVPTPTPFELRSDPEPSAFLSFPATSATDPDGQFNWTQSPGPSYGAPPHPSAEFQQDMSTLGYLTSGVTYHAPLEPPYGSQLDSHYMMNHPHLSHSSAQQVLPNPTTASSTSSSSLYPTSMLQSSPGLDRRQSSGRPDLLPPYGQRSPYPQSSSIRTSPGPLSYTTSAENPSIQTSHSGYSQLPSQPLSHLNYSPYPPPQQQYVSSAEYMPSYHAASAPGTPPTSMYTQSSTAGYPPQYATGMADTPLPGMDPARNVRVINSRPKPQCWEHGCNGRQFSTFSNLLRHQREKSGTAGKSYCPRCGAEFTRTTAMKGHMNNDKCKPRRTSETN